MTVSTTGPASDGLVYLTMVGHDGAGHTTIIQGSGVLLSNDEVLTAAHVVYNDDGSLRTAGVASVGHHGSASLAVSTVDGVQAQPKQDYTTLAGIGSDFAVVHLKTPVASGTNFSVGSDLTSGTFQVSGYPLGTSGTLDTRTETLAVAAGTEVYTGETLHDGTGNPDGSSGGSIYQVINGQPTAFGVISADLSTDTSKGFFKALTAADASQIRAWVASADAGASQPAAVAVPPAAQATDSALAAETTSATANSIVAGLSRDAASGLASDAAFVTGQRHVVMSDVAAAITQVCNEDGTAARTQDAADYLNANASLARRAVAYLAGFLSGTTGAWSGSLASTADTIIVGAVDDAATRHAAAAGRAEGLAMGTSNTSATVDLGSAALAHILSASADAAAETGLSLTPQAGHPSFQLLAHHDHH